MTTDTTLIALRGRHFALQDLPETIRIPALGDRRDEIVKPTTDATVDDIAFALLALDAEVDALYGRVGALRKLQALARRHGARGADRVIDAIPAGKETV
ncbi:conserved hypothetical protein [uncultured Gammaproteobacteria bacterium]